MLALLPTHLNLEGIAERLGCSRSTVKTHVAHIYEKLGAGTRLEAVERAGEAGLLGDPDAGDRSALRRPPPGASGGLPATRRRASGTEGRTVR